MMSVQDRLKLKRAPTDIWSIREQLQLAASVLISGDQNWISVSRSLRPVANTDPARPPDWFSQKACAQQYAYLLEKDIPKRKKRESGETTSESIVKRLTQDRISEITETLAAQREEFRQLKDEVSLLKNGTVSDEKLKKMWLAIQREELELSQNNRVPISRLAKIPRIKDTRSPQVASQQNIQSKINDSATDNLKRVNVEEGKRNRSERASLLTSLLESSSSTQMRETPQAVGSPTIASLLCSSPKVLDQVPMQNVHSQIQSISNTISDAVQEQLHDNVRTLPMVSGPDSAGKQEVTQQHSENPSILINPLNTRSVRAPHGAINIITEAQQIIPKQQTLIADVTPKVMEMDKDEMNEIIGDIEELIKDEISNSPQALEPLLKTDEIVDRLKSEAPTIPRMQYIEPKNVDDKVSLSSSPISEISIEEIDSSTSNIAEIIGTAIEPVVSSIGNPDISKDFDKLREFEFTEDTEEKPVKFSVSKESAIKNEDMQETGSQNVIYNEPKDTTSSIENEPISNQENEQAAKKETPEINVIDNETMSAHKHSIDEKEIRDREERIRCQGVSIQDNLSSFPDKTHSPLKQREKNKQQDLAVGVKDKISVQCSQSEAKDREDERASYEETGDSKVHFNSEEASLQNVHTIAKEVKLEKEYKFFKSESENMKKEIIHDPEAFKNVRPKDEGTDGNVVFDTAADCEEDNDKLLRRNKLIAYGTPVTEENSKKMVKNPVFERNPCYQDVKINNEIKSEKRIKDENEGEKYKHPREILSDGTESPVIKGENVESTETIEELDDEEPTMSKLNGGRGMKTYSKKQNATVDSESEIEMSGETADYRAWKKSIMLVYNRLATHKYASIFLRPITEDQAPGYHSIVFRPMDLWTIKKNIDNGIIRSTMHFQRDIMLMFQNAIMFNKHNTLVHKMTLEMQEECLQHMQVLVQAAGEASFRRETRTAASISNETCDSGLKRKWTIVTSNPHETDIFRIKKQRKPENE